MKFATLLLTVLCAMGAERLTLPVTADTTVTFADLASKPEPPRGAEPRLVIQGRVSFALLQFDTSALKGFRVTRAMLRVHAAPSPVPLHTVGISTVSGNGPWKEREAIFYRPSPTGWWSYQGSDLVDVTFSQGGSLYVYPRVRNAGNGWFEADVSPEIVTALATGDQFGILLTDEKGQTRTRHVLSSKEGKHPPVLVVEADRPNAKIPAAPRGRREGGALVFEGSRARLDVRYAQAPIKGFAAAKPYPRWLIDPLAPKPHPLATNNTLSGMVTVNLDDLAPGTYYFASRTLDERGTASPVTEVGPVQIDAPLSRKLPAADPVRGSDGPRSGVWTAPDTVKINPVTGALLERDVIWNGGVKLTGARNEFVAFQLAVEGVQNGVTVEISKPLFAGDKLPAVLQKTGAMQLYREWFVRDDKNPNLFHPDPLVPLTEPFDIPSTDNPVPGQTVQPVFVDVYIPHDAKPGVHTGELRVRSKTGLDRRVPVEVSVLPLMLPDKVSFVVDLNCYSGVEGPTRGTPEYRAVEHAFHRVAHLHRTNLDVLGYSHNGTTVPDHAPPLTGEGAETRVADWKDWDAHWGPLVSGELFQDMPRAGVPVDAMYLPFFENWPGDLRKHYRADNPAVPKTTEEYEALITRHALTAGPIEEEFSKEYQDRFSAVALDFARHIKSRGWNTHTKFVVYFNNKYYWKRPEQGGHGIGWWLLDEPNHRDDVRAISFLGWLAMRRLGEAPGSNIIFRTDISRVDWMRDLLTGQIDLNAISRRFHEKPRLLRDRNRFGKELWNYASTNHPRSTNVMLRAWAWRVWLNGGDGLLPWLATRTQNAWERAEPLTVFYSGAKFGQTEPFASLRLKAYRRGQQDIEYLNLLAKSKGWSREVLTRSVREALDLAAEVEEKYEEDAGTMRFQNIQNRDLETLRRQVATALVKP
ncbi:MAG: DUF4091 domain-containing protein [Bryobacterales bacterium]|nr:DUF4091 domain-containing protein [Bryobacterales bacterium]